MPARNRPRRNLRTSEAGRPASTTGNRQVAPPASRDDTAKSQRPGTRSARLSRAEASAPTTNPSCTDMVNQALPEAVNPQAVVSAGTIAEAENQTDIPR